MMQRAHFHSFLVPHQAVVGDEIHEALEYRRKIGHHAVQDTEHLANYMFRRGNFDECIKLLERLLGGWTNIVKSARAAELRYHASWPVKTRSHLRRLTVFLQGTNPEKVKMCEASQSATHRSCLSVLVSRETRVH